MGKKKVIIRLKNVSKTFHIKDRNVSSIRGRLFNLFNPNVSRKIEALDGINIEIYEGEFIGIVGKNGSGKSTLLKIMSEVYPPDKGSIVEINGRFQKLTLGTGFDEDLTARENIYLNASLNGISFKKIGNIFHSIVEFAELEDFVETKVKYYSSGMVSRLAFSIAVYADADIFFMDELVGGVGDINFLQKSEQVFKDSVLKGRTIINVSHDLDIISEYCDRVLLLDGGKQVAFDTPEVVLNKYKQMN